MTPHTGSIPNVAFRIFPLGLTFLAAAVLLLAATAGAQDSHYWNNQYGTKAELLGGLVVGSASDISAAYYNPAWLALGTDASLLLTTRALEYSTLEIKNAVGSGENPKHTQFRPSPGFLGGQFGKTKEEITLQSEMLVRAYDPCISCSVHMLDVEFIE